LQNSVSQYLRDLAKPEFAEQIGLLGERLLTPASTAQVRYKFHAVRAWRGWLAGARADGQYRPAI
jgi:hypothetical protein